MQLLNTNSTSYKKIKELGEGSFGEVFLVQSIKNSQMLVSKEMRLQGLDEPTIIQLYTEVKVLENIKHPNIIEMIETYRTKSNKLVLILEYASNGDLAHYIKNCGVEYIPETQIRLWIIQLCLALKHSHDHKIVHRDLKTSNVFLDADFNVKLGDFGLAVNLIESRQHNKGMTGTPLYLAPEAITKGVCSYKGDVWSLGVVLYELCALKNPFFATNYGTLVHKVCHEPIEPLPDIYSPELREFVMSLLERSEQLRPTIKALFETELIQDILIKNKSEFRKLISVTTLSNIELTDNGMKKDFAKMKVYRFSEYKDPNAFIENIQHIVNREEKISKFKNKKVSISYSESSEESQESNANVSEIVEDTAFVADIKRNIRGSEQDNFFNDSALLSKVESEDIITISQLKRQEKTKNKDSLLSSDSNEIQSKTDEANFNCNLLSVYDSNQSLINGRDIKDSNANKVTIDTMNNQSKLLIVKNRQLLDSLFDNRNLLLSGLTPKAVNDHSRKISVEQFRTSNVNNLINNSEDSRLKTEKLSSGIATKKPKNFVIDSKMIKTFNNKMQHDLITPKIKGFEKRKSSLSGLNNKKSFFMQYKGTTIMQSPLPNKVKISTIDRKKTNVNKRVEQSVEIKLENRTNQIISHLSPVKSHKKGPLIKQNTKEWVKFHTEHKENEYKSEPSDHIKGFSKKLKLIKININNIADNKIKTTLNPVITPKKLTTRRLEDKSKPITSSNNLNNLPTIPNNINSVKSHLSEKSTDRKRTKTSTSITKNVNNNLDEYGLSIVNYKRNTPLTPIHNPLEFKDVQKLLRKSKISEVERKKTAIMEKYGNKFNLAYSGVKKFLVHYGLKYIEENMNDEDQIIQMLDRFVQGRPDMYKNQKSAIDLEIGRAHV